ncbi:HAMP domain-containing sensor histidine kinase [uncultured Massilia sp.]|uniref:sensor histidine kinase n=1 Tax=uncultured Massilia sp. TaxID=169973 RepID=UPI0025DAADFA|nr:HAMP domain-containing sensor histidine kinase [uncultured Massilia sp.]
MKLLHGVIRAAGRAAPRAGAPDGRVARALRQWLVRRQGEHARVATRLRFLAWIGCLGMPAYYVVWTAWFPQHYESPGLRALGVALCLPALFAHRFPDGLPARAYEFVGVCYVLPFFFTYMFLMNHGSAVWAQSLLAALIVLFHFDWWWALAAFACGTGAAAALFAVAGDGTPLVRTHMLEQLPIYAFTILVVSVTKLGRSVLAREKLAGMAQALAMVSHELRTPLMGVSANVRGIERALAARRRAGGEPEPAVDAALARIGYDVRHMNRLVDLFLQSATVLERQLAPTECLSMAQAVEAALDRYPFADGAQRGLVEVVVRRDFAFAGRADLCAVLLLNLLRNAFKALQRAGKGKVRIIVDGAAARPRLLVMDSGCGIPARQLPLIFERFHSWPPGAGSGIGLALCDDIVRAWHGTIRCRSRERAWTVFALAFPRAPGLASSSPSPSPH